MLEGALAGTGMTTPAICNHEIDYNKMPRWDKRLGCVHVCKLCGVELVKNLMLVPNRGFRTKVRMSKKDRRNIKKLEVAMREAKGNSE